MASISDADNENKVGIDISTSVYTYAFFPKEQPYPLVYLPIALPRKYGQETFVLSCLSMPTARGNIVTEPEQTLTQIWGTS